MEDDEDGRILMLLLMSEGGQSDSSGSEVSDRGHLVQGFGTGGACRLGELGPEVDIA